MGFPASCIRNEAGFISAVAADFASESHPAGSRKVSVGLQEVGETSLESLCASNPSIKVCSFVHDENLKVATDKTKIKDKQWHSTPLDCNQSSETENKRQCALLSLVFSTGQLWSEQLGGRRRSGRSGADGEEGKEAAWEAKSKRLQM